ncbi:complement component 3-like protein [Sarcoptes scabiei]|uniref:Complement component 3-like protein n=1 Tax=Sarcoptes scabiei TaxID=52283 RepID=A0A132A4C0_SARSC|nr:complement component 3-like protein [Sarcoptes scabiei]
MKVKANSSATKAFPIIPIQVGVFTIKLMASSHYYRRSMSDVILKNITVVFPGVVKEQSQSFDLDPTNRAKRETRVHNNYTSTSQVTSVIDPENLYQKIDIFLNKSDDKIIPGTMRHKLSFIGQKFNPTIKSMEELENLITKPKGCGEQNMYYMAFNLYTLMYLDKIGKLNHTIQSRATIYLQRAYRQQMNFRKDDGSFSAFMNRPSSIWLTAFISKVFCQSANYMKNFETGVIIDAIKWLQKQQNQNGSWTEIYPILHSRALGGVDQDDQTLTAYILIALNQCDNFFNSKQDERYQKMNLNDTIQQTVAYLIRHQMNRMDLEQNSYSLALSTYALLFQHNRNGFGKVELLTIYNVYEPSSICSFDLEVTLKASQKSVVQNIKHILFAPKERFGQQFCKESD